jgi:hypothetical protein
VVNGDFETGDMTGWTDYSGVYPEGSGTVTTEASAAAKHAGDFGGRFEVTWDSVATFMNQADRYQLVSENGLHVGDVFDFWVKIPTWVLDGADVDVRVIVSDYGEIAFTVWTGAGAQDWQHVHVALTEEDAFPPEGNVWLDVLVYAGGTDSTGEIEVWVDDITLTQSLDLMDLAKGGFEECPPLSPWVDVSDGGYVSIASDHPYSGAKNAMCFVSITAPTTESFTSAFEQEIGAVALGEGISLWYRVWYNGATGHGADASVLVELVDLSASENPNQTILSLEDPSAGDWIHAGDVADWTSGYAKIVVTAALAGDGTGSGLWIFETEWDDFSVGGSEGAAVDGDYYLNTTTGDVYHKESGTWVLVGNIRGPTGVGGGSRAFSFFIG